MKLTCRKDPIKRLLLPLALFLLSSACQSEGAEARRLASDNGPTPIPTAAVVLKPTYVVERGDVLSQLHFTGRVAPVVEEVLTAHLDGVISKIYVKRGDSVQAGDLLAELDPTSNLTIAYRQAEIRTELAQLDLDYALARAYTPPTIDQQYQIDRLTLQLESARLELDELQITVGPDLESAMHITAPFDGEIVSLGVNTGQHVLVGDTLGVLADLNQIEISAELRDSQMQELTENMQVIIEPSGHPGDPLPGILSRLPYPYGSGGESEAVDADPGVRISFQDPALAMVQYELGDLVSLTITIAERTNVLFLPQVAIREYNGRKFVVVQDSETQQRVDVTLGITGEGRVEILEGLTEGQIIVGQ